MQEDSFPRVSIAFRFPPTDTKSRVETTIITKNETPVDLNSTSLTATYEYSGRHDHGELATLRTGGDLAVLIGSIEEAKKECDKYLTDCINVEYGYEPKITKGDVDSGNISDSEEKMMGNKKKKIKK